VVCKYQLEEWTNSGDKVQNYLTICTCRKIREPFRGIVSDDGANKICTNTFGLDARKGLHEVIHVQDACIVEPAFGAVLGGRFCL